VSASVAGPVNVCPTTTTTYSATVTDYNGLTATVSATVTVNSLPNPSVSVIPVTCNGLSDGGASVTIAGGPYTYSWNSVPVQTGSTLSNVPGGIYNVTITNAQNCQKVVPANVIQPAPLSFNIHVISSACGQANGSSTMIPVGGTAPYSYVWNTNPIQTTATASNLPAGNYHVDLTDANGCTQSADVQIDNHIGHSAYIDFLQPISCQGGSDGSLIAIPLSGTPPFNYLWSNGQTTQIATGLAAGTHTVQVSDVLNCPLTYSYTIDDAPGMGIQVNVTDAACGQLNGAASLTLTGGFGPFTINWASNPGQNVMAISNVHAGANSVSVSDQVGCTYTTNF
ncbi:MAG: SprB repeat-containing protein, partial [Bacteroidia bacterium]